MQSNDNKSDLTASHRISTRRPQRQQPPSPTRPNIQKHTIHKIKLDILTLITTRSQKSWSCGIGSK